MAVLDGDGEITPGKVVDGIVSEEAGGFVALEVRTIELR